MTNSDRFDAVGLSNFHEIRGVITFGSASFHPSLKVGFLESFGDAIDMVINNKSFYFYLVVNKGLEFLDIHVHPAVADGTNRILSFVACQPGAHGAGKGETHGRVAVIGDISLTVLGFKGVI